MPDPKYHSLFKVGFIVCSAALLIASGSALFFYLATGDSGWHPMGGSGKGSSNMPVSVNGGGSLTVRAQGWDISEVTGDAYQAPCAVLKSGFLEFLGLTVIELDGVTDGRGMPKLQSK